VGEEDVEETLEVVERGEQEVMGSERERKKEVMTKR